jgi:hypothetical protein
MKGAYVRREGVVVRAFQEFLDYLVSFHYVIIY